MRFIGLLIFTLCSIQLVGQLPDFYSDYTERDVKKKTWFSEEAVHNEIEYPDEWNKYSAIFLTYHVSHEAIEDNKIYTAIVSSLTHIRVKLLDDAAVSKFSEFYYKMEPGIGNFGDKYIGIRVVKPNGSATKVSKSEAVEEEDGKMKLAIPDLEIGDILDYYIFDKSPSSGITNGTYVAADRFPVQDEYPIKNFEYIVTCDNNWEVQFTTGKNGYKINESIVKERGKKMLRFSVKESDIPAIESQIWQNPYLSAPYIKNYLKYSYKNMSYEKPSDTNILRKTSLEEEEIEDTYTRFYFPDAAARNEYNAFKKFLSKNNKENISKERKLEEYFKFIRHKFMNMHYVHDQFHNEGFREEKMELIMGHIRYGLQAMDIPYEILVVANKDIGHYEDMINVGETDYVIKINMKNDVYLYKPDPFTLFNHLPYRVEGANAFVVDAEGNDINVSRFQIPISKPENNKMNHVSTIDLDLDNHEKISVNTNIKLTGHQIENYPERLCNWQKMIWDENKKYGTKLWGHPDEYKRGDQIKFQQYQKDVKKDIKERLKKYANNHYDLEIKELKKASAKLKSGSKESQVLEIQFDFDLENMVKKVGPNYIVKIGQMVGGQVTPDHDEKRIYPICMDYPRMYNYQIEFKIPDGYEVDGLEELNNDIDNETGHFKSSAKVEENILKISFEKMYKHNYEPTENWEKMKAFLTPATKFNSKEIMLRKK